jgi:hypothetical protein
MQDQVWLAMCDLSNCAAGGAGGDTAWGQRVCPADMALFQC